MIVASETAKFGQPEVTIGITPGGGGTQRLARLLGKNLAMEMIINNRTLTAAEALQFGLANRVVPVDGYLDAAVAFAEEIASRAPLAVRMAKDSINAAFETTLTEGLESREAEFLSAVFNRRSKGRHESLHRKTKAELEREVV